MCRSTCSCGAKWTFYDSCSNDDSFRRFWLLYIHNGLFGISLSWRICTANRYMIYWGFSSFSGFLFHLCYGFGRIFGLFFYADKPECGACSNPSDWQIETANRILGSSVLVAEQKRRARWKLLAAMKKVTMNPIYLGLHIWTIGDNRDGRKRYHIIWWRFKQEACAF